MPALAGDDHVRELQMKQEWWTLYPTRPVGFTISDTAIRQASVVDLNTVGSLPPHNEMLKTHDLSMASRGSACT
jgi:hypothetical protein